MDSINNKPIVLSESFKKKWDEDHKPFRIDIRQKDIEILQRNMTDMRFFAEACDLELLEVFEWLDGQLSYTGTKRPYGWPEAPKETIISDLHKTVWAVTFQKILCKQCDKPLETEKDEMGRNVYTTCFCSEECEKNFSEQTRQLRRDVLGL